MSLMQIPNPWYVSQLLPIPLQSCLLRTIITEGTYVTEALGRWISTSRNVTSIGHIPLDQRGHATHQNLPHAKIIWVVFHHLNKEAQPLLLLMFANCNDSFKAILGTMQAIKKWIVSMLTWYTISWMSHWIPLLWKFRLMKAIFTNDFPAMSPFWLINAPITTNYKVIKISDLLITGYPQVYHQPEHLQPAPALVGKIKRVLTHNYYRMDELSSDWNTIGQQKFSTNQTQAPTVCGSPTGLTMDDKDLWSEQTTHA